MLCLPSCSAILLKWAITLFVLLVVELAATKDRPPTATVTLDLHHLWGRCKYLVITKLYKIASVSDTTHFKHLVSSDATSLRDLSTLLSTRH